MPWLQFILGQLTMAKWVPWAESSTNFSQASKSFQWCNEQTLPKWMEKELPWLSFILTSNITVSRSYSSLLVSTLSVTYTAHIHPRPCLLLPHDLTSPYLPIPSLTKRWYKRAYIDGTINVGPEPFQCIILCHRNLAWWELYIGGNSREVFGMPVSQWFWKYRRTLGK